MSSWYYCVLLIGFWQIQVLGADRRPGPRPLNDCGKRSSETGLRSPHHCSTCNLILDWWDDRDDVVLELQAKVGRDRSVWAAVGLSLDQAMGASDVLACVVEEGGAMRLLDGWTLPQGHHFVADKQAQGPVLLNGSIVDGTLTCRFSRPRQSADNRQDYNLTRPYFLLLASGPLSAGAGVALEQHTQVAWSSRECSLSLCGGRCPVGDCPASLLLLKAHGVVMVIVFILLLPTAAVIARHYKAVFLDRWFWAHQLLVGVALLLLLLGLALVLSHTRGTFSAGLHQVSGVTSALLFALQLLLGILRPAKGPSTKRKLFVLVHRSIAIVVLSSGVLTCVWGVLLLHSTAHCWLLGAITLAGLAGAALAVHMECCTWPLTGPSIPPVVYRRVLKEDSDSAEEEDVFMKRPEVNQRTERQLEPRQSFQREKALLVLFVGVAFSFTTMAATLIAAFSSAVD